MLPQSPRPRAADDYPAIRARLEELRAERAQVEAEGETCLEPGSRPYYSVGNLPTPAVKHHLQAVMRRLIAR